MKHINFDSVDLTSVDTGMPVPEQNVRDLLCMTEKSIQYLAQRMETMATNVQAMTDCLTRDFPVMINLMRDVCETIERKTDEGVTKSDEAMASWDKLTEAIQRLSVLLEQRDV